MQRSGVIGKPAGLAIGAVFGSAFGLLALLLCMTAHQAWPLAATVFWGVYFGVGLGFRKELKTYLITFAMSLGIQYLLCGLSKPLWVFIRIKSSYIGFGLTLGEVLARCFLPSLLSKNCLLHTALLALISMVFVGILLVRDRKRQKESSWVLSDFKPCRHLVHDGERR